jgi:hypothetical protein
MAETAKIGAVFGMPSLAVLERAFLREFTACRRRE